MNARKIRWGIIGCAGIAIHGVIQGINESHTGEVVAIASRDLAKAQHTAEKSGIAKAYGSYAELIADREIEAVYIPLPNHLHKEWTIKATQAGKHVLCEKPFALDAQEAQEMVFAAEQAGVQLAEAFMYRHHPRFDEIQQIIQSGEIGQLRAIHGSFTFHGDLDRENTRYVRHMGGGSIYDVGVYPISAARMIFGTEPEAVTVHAQFSEKHDDVDMMASGLIEFPNKLALTFDCGMWTYFRNELEIIGSKGRILLPYAFLHPHESNFNFTVETESSSRMVEITIANQYSMQADDLAYAIWGQKPMRFAPSDAINNMRVVDACLESARKRIRVIL